MKINIGDKGRAWRFDLEGEALIGKKIGEEIEGRTIKEELEGYQLLITGTSDKAGFPGMKDIDSPMLTKRLLKKGFGMKTVKPKGLRLRKTLRGAIISEDTAQINFKVIREGKKRIMEVFPEQNKPTETPQEKIEEKKE